MPQNFGSTIHRVLAFAVLHLPLLAILGCGFSPTSTGSGTTGAVTFQGGTLSASVIGYAWDSSIRGLRPIVGVSGASSLGAPIFAGYQYTSAAACIQRKYALFTDAKNSVFLARLPSGQPTALSSGLSSKQQLRLSPSGSAALIYAPDQTSVILIQGLPQSPQLQKLLIPSSLTISQAVVSDAGLVAFASDSPGGVLVVRSFTPSGSVTQIGQVSSLGGLAFLPRSTSLVMADSRQNTISLATGLPSSTNVHEVSNSSQGIHQPLMVAGSSDGRWITVANQDGSFVRIDLTLQTTANVAKCGCSATAMIPLSGNNVFLVSDLSAGPLWMFDGDPLVSRMVFVAGLKQSASVGGRN